MTGLPYPLVQKIRAALANAEDAMWEEADEQGYPDAKSKVGTARYLNPSSALSSNLEQAFGDLRMLAETMGQRDCVERVKHFVAEEKGQFGRVSFDRESDDSYSTGLNQAKAYFESLLAVRDGRATADPQPFENILRNTAKIVHAASLDPHNETGVKDAVYEVLRLAYPDVVRKLQMAHPIKTYVPDFASKSAQSVAEYKFAIDQVALKVCCDHLAKSMLGYSGDATWAEKFGVIYLTSPVASQAEVDAHFKSVGKPDDWRIILLNGKGRTTKRGKTKAPNNSANVHPKRGQRKPLRLSR